MKNIFFAISLLFPCHIIAQQVITLDEAIAIAHKKSPQVQVARLSFMSRYWNYRSYESELLPSLSLNGTVGNYNRSLVQVQDYNTGEIRYVRNNILSNSLGLALTQNIPFTGGTLSLNTNLYRLDQFTNNTITFNSNPVTINYTQPLRAYNELKWQKKTAPREYEKAKRNLLESTEDITIDVSSLFFEALSLQVDYEKSLLSLEDNTKLFALAQQRFELGSITKNELLQLELAMHQSKLEVNDNLISVDIALNDLSTYLGIAESTHFRLKPPVQIPSIELDYYQVLDLALQNSSFLLEQELKRLYAGESVAQAKSLRGLQATLNANLGLSQSADKLGNAYKNLRDQEIVSVGLSIPIFDWGMSRGRVKMAQAQEQLVQAEVEQEDIKFRKDLFIKVLRFNNQAEQCRISQRAMEVADERYKISYQQFENGSITVTDLNTAQNEQKTASRQFVEQLGVLWGSYFEIRKLTLYDFISNKNLSAEFDKIIQ